MILVDTSVWVDHLRRGDRELTALLNGSRVLTHPLVLGELACGNMSNRRSVLALIRGLPASAVADDDEVLFFIERHKLMGCGIGYIDAHLLAAVQLTDSAWLWTRDKRLRRIAETLSLAYVRP